MVFDNAPAKLEQAFSDGTLFSVPSDWLFETLRSVPGLSTSSCEKLINDLSKYVSLFTMDSLPPSFDWEKEADVVAGREWRAFILFGLKAKPELNGRAVIPRRFVKDSGRWSVSLVSASQLSSFVSTLGYFHWLKGSEDTLSVKVLNLAWLDIEALHEVCSPVPDTYPLPDAQRPFG